MPRGVGGDGSSAVELARAGALASPLGEEPARGVELLDLGVGDVDAARGAGCDSLRDLELAVPGPLASPLLGESNRGEGGRRQDQEQGDRDRHDRRPEPAAHPANLPVGP